MPETTRSGRLRRGAAVAALCVGLTAGGYGIATAANSGGTTTSQTQAGDHDGRHADETPLTGDALAKVTAAAKAKAPGATVDRVETDSDGNAKYEAHMTKADGTEVSVYVDAQFNAVSVETGGHGGRRDGNGRHPGSRGDETALTGDALAKVTAAAQAKVPGGTIERVETDADGNAKYEAHMTKADGSEVTVYVDAQFQVVSVEQR